MDWCVNKWQMENRSGLTVIVIAFYGVYCISMVTNSLAVHVFVLYTMYMYCRYCHIGAVHMREKSSENTGTQ